MASNPWFRFYHEFAGDPKVQSMSEAMQRRLVMLFCFRCSNALETLRDSDIAIALRITPGEWETTKLELFQKRFIDDECNILNWNKRQYISDTSTARVRKYRDKKKRFSSVTEPLQKRFPSVSVLDINSLNIQESNEKKENKSEKEKVSIRHEYGSEKNVLLTDTQYSKLVADLGEPLALACIEELSQAKAMKGYKYKRDDLAIRKWVIDAVKAKGQSGPALPKAYVPPEELAELTKRIDEHYQQLEESEAHG